MNSNRNCRWPQCSCHDGPKLPCLYEKPEVHVERARSTALASVGMDPKRPLEERLAAAKANIAAIRREMGRAAKRADAAPSDR